MPYIPHTARDVEEMLAAIGAASIDELFEEIPSELVNTRLEQVPPGLDEMEVRRLAQQRAQTDGQFVNFIGAGAYEHHVPSAVWQLATRGEFYSAYTPYQAEASQGTLQLLYEYQTMMASLTGMDVSNASMYDGASALAEAVLMAVRVQRKASRIVMPDTVHPAYREVVQTIVSDQGIDLLTITHARERGIVNVDTLSGSATDDEVAALIIPQPNFFGQLEDVDLLTDLAHERGWLVIAVVNPISLALLKAPGEWGADGADIVIGEGQPLGIPLSSGGPYFGFLCCRQKLVRQMPGRLIGRTVDMDGKPGYTLTLQAREQHIRRSKATSNICTNQGLMVTAATLYMSLMGASGIERVANASHANTRLLVGMLTAIDGVERVHSGSFFHECVIRIQAPLADILGTLEAQGIVAGLPLGQYFPYLQDCLLICATEMRTEQEMAAYARQLDRVVSQYRQNPTAAGNP
jgi:glycine dehydrogenase subunit 1